MTTRSGRGYKCLSMSDLEEEVAHIALEDTGARGGASLEQGSRGGSPRREMVTVIQMLVEDRGDERRRLPKIASGERARWSSASRKCGSRWR